MSKDIELPLSEKLVNYIRTERPIESEFIISTVTSTAKKVVDDQKSLLCKGLVAMLGKSTNEFVEKLYDLNESKEEGRKRLVSFKEEPRIYFGGAESKSVGEEDFKKKRKMEERAPAETDEYVSYNTYFKDDVDEMDKQKSREVIFNKVDDLKHSQAKLLEYVQNYGKLESFRRLNRGKWLWVFEDAETAVKLVMSTKHVCNDSSIKKYFNVYAPEFVKVDKNEMTKNDIQSLLKTQQELMERIEASRSFREWNSLKSVTAQIRSQLMREPEKAQFQNTNRSRRRDPRAEIEEAKKMDSIYSDYFS
ncbi:hypothetical protein ECANGB1_694 [Enterospora canceri]|uniref:Uncharacterized protein n=1 Tax=Enterospora canceri TaxID=1081671 RepID=A0A1Y1S7K3_9MICR|nr:hypothetical protein ECANGB1_694 [Enterospora canceri]